MTLSENFWTGNETRTRNLRALQAEDPYRSTLIIISAKHGQSPIDRNKNHNIGNGQPSTFLGANEALDISDDGSLIWLADSSLTPSVVASLSLPANQKLLGIQVSCRWTGCSRQS